MNREKIGRLEETIRKLKKSNRVCKRRTKALRKKNKKLKRKLEEFETKESGHIYYYQEDSDVGAKEICSNHPNHPTFSEAVANSSNKFSLDLYKEVLREKSSIEGGIITSLVDNLLGGDKEKRIANLVMSGLAISTVLAFCMISLKNRSMISLSFITVFLGLSVSTVLAMLRVGAKGNTLQQINDALYLPKGRAAGTGYRF